MSESIIPSTNILNVSIRTPETVLFKGTADSVSTKNEKGPMDVLPEHESFITIILEKVVVHKKGEKDQEFALTNGILKVYKDSVYVFIGV